MLTNLDPASELFLAQLNGVQQRLARASREISSGKKISSPSDAPDQIEPLLQLRAARSHNTQVQANLALAKTDADEADNALAAGIKLMDRALVLADQGANTTLEAGSRQSLAQEVESLIEQMVSLSRTTVQGRFIFSGNDPASPAYALDWTAANCATQLSSAPANSRIEAAGGTSFLASKTAQEIFDNQNPDGTPASDNVFAALSALRTALRNNDTDAVGAAIGQIRSASYHLNSMEAFYGTVQKRVQDSTDAAGKYDIELQTQLSQKEDADAVSAALEITQSNTQLQAAFQMRAKLPKTSLFDYLG